MFIIFCHFLEQCLHISSQKDPSETESHYSRVIPRYLVGEKYRECSSPFDLLDILTVENSHLHCNLLNSPISGIKNSSQVYLMNTFTMPGMSILTIPVMPQKATFIKQVLGPTEKTT